MRVACPDICADCRRGGAAERRQAACPEEHLRLVRKLLRCQRYRASDLGDTGAVLLGIVHYLNENDVDRVVEGLREVAVW